jgi:hypothetical protein
MPFGGHAGFAGVAVWRPLGIACDADRGHAGFAGVTGLHRGTASGA